MSRRVNEAKFSTEVSFNSHDTKCWVNDRGRTVLTRDERGVYLRTGILIAYIGCNQYGKTSDQQVEYLQTRISKSYTKADLAQPHRVMRKLGVAYCANRRWKLTPQGKKIWREMTPIFMKPSVVDE